MFSIKKRLLTALILLLSTISYSQHNNLLNNSHIRANYIHGYLLPEYSFLSYLTNDYIKAFEIDAYKELEGNKLWERVYKYPSVGVSIRYTSLGNDNVFGKAIAANPYIRFNLLNRQKFKLQYNFGVGLSYLNKKFDLSTNYQDIAIGSHVNLWVNSQLNVSYQIYKNISLIAGTNFNHISNANLQEPNIGFNMWNFMLGADVRVGAETVKNTDVIPEFEDKNQYAVIIAGANKHTRRFAEKTYFAASVSFEYKRIFGHRISLGTGADLFFDSSVPDEMIRADLPDGRDLYKYKSGVHLSQEIIFGKLSFGIQEGFYLFLTDKLDHHKMYNRGIIRYKISEHLFLNLAMKSNVVVLDVMEVGIGYYWN